MAQWIVLAAHGQRVVGSNSIRVIGDVRKGMRTQLLLCSKDKPEIGKKTNWGFSQGMQTLNKLEFLLTHGK